MSEDVSAHIVLLVAEFHINSAQSLKDKRRVIKSIKDRISNSYNVSVAEIGEHDKWQRAVLGFTMIGHDKRHLEGSIQKLTDKLGVHPEAVLAGSQLEWL